MKQRTFSSLNTNKGLFTISKTNKEGDREKERQDCEKERQDREKERKDREKERQDREKERQDCEKERKDCEKERQDREKERQDCPFSGGLSHYFEKSFGLFDSNSFNIGQHGFL